MTETYYWDVGNATRMGEYLTQKESEFIDAELPDTPVSCLDVGSGSGRFSIPLFKRGLNVIALEKSLLPLTKLHGKERNIPSILSDAQKLPFKEGFFDYIIGIEILDFLDADIFFNECRRILRKGGYLLITFSNKRSFKGINRKLIAQLMRKTLYQEFYNHSYEDFLEKLNKCGFSLKSSYGYNWLPANRTSNSNLLGLFIYLERLFGLQHFPSISPWVFVIARKEDR